jgi:NAD(P)-dependent dehydrogenase (short-subunit alcohol dehydrogenase family)
VRRSSGASTTWSPGKLAATQRQIAELTALSEQLGYGISKTALIELAAMLASQYADRGIRSFSVQPGVVLTPQVAVGIADGTFAADEYTPAEHTAWTIVWLASAPEAAALNGALISAPQFVHDKALLP